MTARLVVTSFLAAFLLAGCASSGILPKAPVVSTTAVASRTIARTPPPPPADPNIALCVRVHDYFLAEILPTVGRWDPAGNEFDTTVSAELRDEATHLFRLQTQSTGSVAQAIGAEATALVNLSIGIDEQDDTALGSAADATNSALAGVRGVCNF